MKYLPVNLNLKETKVYQWYGVYTTINHGKAKGRTAAGGL
jgi:hypothetical protein